MKNIKTLLRFPSNMDKKYLGVLRAAIFKFEEAEQAKKTIRRYLSRSRRHYLNLVNPYSRQEFREYLLTAVADMEDTKVATAGVVMLASLSDRGWACCDRNFKFDFVNAKQKIRNAFAGMDYIAVFEAGVYPETPWEADGK